MKVEDNNPNIEEVNWKYFPNFYQLSQYLAQSDLIQLSLTCKYLRLKLKSKCTSKLVLMRRGEVIPGKPNKPSKKKQLVSLFDILEEDYLDRYSVVKHCVIREFFNTRFARNFFNLFTNITKLELRLYFKEDNYIRGINDYTIRSNLVLIEALYPLRKLESLKICSEFIDDYESSSKLFLKLPLSLKILFVTEYEDCYRNLNFYSIDSINGEYSNLKQVNIFNNKMLRNMTTRMESLTDVTISNREDFDISNLAEFFSLNPQLEKLTIPDYLIEYRSANSILQMQKLKQLNIEYSMHEGLGEISNLPVNTSIEHLNIICSTSTDRLVPFLNNLKSLKVLEFSNNNLYNFMMIDFLACTNRIPLLHLNNLCFSYHQISRFYNPKIFDKIRLTNFFELDYYLANNEGDNLEDWDVYNLGPANSRDFTLINKNKE